MKLYRKIWSMGLFTGGLMTYAGHHLTGTMGWMTVPIIWGIGLAAAGWVWARAREAHRKAFMRRLARACRDAVARPIPGHPDAG